MKNRCAMNCTKHIVEINFNENKHLITTKNLKLSCDYIANGHKSDYKVWARDVCHIVVPPDFDETDSVVSALIDVFRRVFYWMIKTNNDKNLNWRTVTIG